MVTFIEQRKKQKKLIFIFVIVLLVTFLVLWQGFLKKTLEEPRQVEAPISTIEKIKIDFGILESPALKELQPFEEIKAFEEKAGRENPFIPY